MWRQSSSIYYCTTHLSLGLYSHTTLVMTLKNLKMHHLSWWSFGISVPSLQMIVIYASQLEPLLIHVSYWIWLKWSQLRACSDLGDFPYTSCKLLLFHFLLQESSTPLMNHLNNLKYIPIRQVEFICHLYTFCRSPPLEPLITKDNIHPAVGPLPNPQLS